MKLILAGRFSKLLILARINLHQEEPYFKYFERNKFSEFRQKNILPVAVFFSMRLEKAFTRLNKDFIFTIQKFKSFKGIKFREFREFIVFIIFCAN